MNADLVTHPAGQGRRVVGNYLQELWLASSRFAGSIWINSRQLPCIWHPPLYPFGAIRDLYILNLNSPLSPWARSLPSCKRLVARMQSGPGCKSREAMSEHQQQILQAAIDIIVKQNYSALTMCALARASELNLGAPQDH